MDPKPNSEPHNPVNEKLVKPASATFSGWFRENWFSLLSVIAGSVLVCTYLYPLDVLLVVLGLGGIVFIHELGHFLAAKACDVHVKTFSIGFGPPLPFCSFQYGETYYKLALVPLGGYVAMVGQSEEGETTEEMDAAKDDPRSYRNKSVWQRMLIISAGVIMNVILGGICFIIAYMNGVEEQPAIVASVDPGSAAWRAGVRPGEHVTKLDDMDRPWFDDIRPIVSGTHKGEIVRVETEMNGVKKTYEMEPLRAEGALFPQLGIAPPSSVKLFGLRRDPFPPYFPGSSISKAEGSDGKGFIAGDRLIAMTDPANPGQLAPLDGTKPGLPTANMDLQHRLVQLAGKPITYQVERKADGSKPTIVVPPNFRKETGLRMRMGPVAALRKGSSAEQAGVRERKMEKDKVLEAGDVIAMIELPEPNGASTIFSADSKETPKGPNAAIKPLDPLRLPFELNAWASRLGGVASANRTVKLTVLREIDHTQKPVTLELAWDDSYREHFSGLSNPSSPVPLGGLGLGYLVLNQVDSVVPESSAALAGVQPGDKITHVKFQILGHNGQTTEGRLDEVRESFWAFVDYTLQSQAPHAMFVKIDRGGQEVVANLSAVSDPTWPVPADGFQFMKELERQRASGVGEALQMGARRTMRAIRATYQGLYGMVFGRISVKMISGPITLARASYILAGEDIWKLVLLVALISINLAVVNFLPIPVLDGGHMVFLLYEWVRRKPPPVFLHNILTLIGLAMVLLMMAFSVGLDIWRLITQR